MNVQDRRYRPWQVRIFAATWLAYAGYYFCRKAFYVVKADLGTSLQLDATRLGHLGTAYLAAYMVGQFSSAYFGRKLGPKLLLLSGMGLSLACNVAFGAGNSFWTFALFMALNGLAQGTGWPGCIGSLAFWFRRKQRGSILGVWSTCYQVGSLAATSFAAFMLGWLGWRSSFFGASMVLLAVWFAVLYLHPNRPESVGLAALEDEGDAEERTDSQGSGDSLGWTRSTVVTILMMGGVYFCIKFLRYALWSWTPFFLKKNFGLHGDQAGYLSTVFDVCGFLGVLLAGVVTDKLFDGRRAFTALSMLVLMTAAFAFMYVAGSGSTMLFAVSLGIAGFGLYGPDSLLSGVGAIDVGSKKGALAAAGIINGMGSIGPVFQEEIIGRLYEATGHSLTPVFMLLLVAACGASGMTFLLWLRSKRGLCNL